MCFLNEIFDMKLKQIEESALILKTLHQFPLPIAEKGVYISVINIKSGLSLFQNAVVKLEFF